MVREATSRAPTIRIDGRDFRIADRNLLNQPQVLQIQEAPAQRSESIEWDRTFTTDGTGWGTTLATRPGQYSWGTPALLHVPFIMRPGCQVTEVTWPAYTPLTGSRISFSQLQPDVASVAILIVVTARHVYEFRPDGTWTAFDLGANFTLARGMSKAVQFRNAAMTQAKVYIARPSQFATDYMVERSGGFSGTYSVSPNNRYAEALGMGRDAVGMLVLWRVDENGRLNQCVADGDPSTPGAWQATTASTPISTTLAYANDIAQVGRNLVVARSDGFYTFDSLANPVPITRGHEMAHRKDAGMWMRDFNGSLIAPSGFGIIAIDGLQWQIVGPVSAHRTQRFIPGLEVAVTSMVGNYIYSAVYDGLVDLSYIFLGTPFVEGDESKGPITWHGPIAFVGGKVTDLYIATVYENRLWIGWLEGNTPKMGYIRLDSTFQPYPTSTSGYVYFPEGMLDASGHGLMKEIRKAELAFSPDYPYHAANNSWTVEIWDDQAQQWRAPDAVVPSSSTMVEAWFTTSYPFYRSRLRLGYSTASPASCGLQGVTLRGIERPERTRLYRLTVELGDRSPAPWPKKGRTREDDMDWLRERMESNRRVSVAIDQDRQFNAVLVGLTHQIAQQGDNTVRHMVELQLYEVRDSA